jgi:hypothetical protein
MAAGGAMVPARSFTPRTILRGYFHAKDENRPALLDEVFCDYAELRVVNNAIDMGFPAVTQGREGIADVLVRRFAQTYENVHSFYLASPPERAPRFSCAWLVGMTEKESRCVRVGCGRYDWEFQDEAPFLARGLVLTIEAMQVLASDQFEPVFGWLRTLQYPWSSRVDAVARAPSVAGLEPVLRFLRSPGVEEVERA